MGSWWVFPNLFRGTKWSCSKLISTYFWVDSIKKTGNHLVTLKYGSHKKGYRFDSLTSSLNNQLAPSTFLGSLTMTNSVTDFSIMISQIFSNLGEFWSMEFYYFFLILSLSKIWLVVTYPGAWMLLRSLLASLEIVRSLFPGMERWPA